MIGNSTTKVVSQFDVMIETSVSSLHREMRVIGVRGLAAHSDAKRIPPFQLSELRRILDHNTTEETTAQEEKGEEGPGHASPLTP